MKWHKGTLYRKEWLGKYKAILCVCQLFDRRCMHTNRLWWRVRSQNWNKWINSYRVRLQNWNEWIYIRIFLTVIVNITKACDKNFVWCHLNVAWFSQIKWSTLLNTSHYRILTSQNILAALLHHCFVMKWRHLILWTQLFSIKYIMAI